MLLYFFFTFISFIFFLKSLPIKPLPQWATEMRLVSLLFFQEYKLFSQFSFPKMDNQSKLEETETPTPRSQEFKLLDLPELALDCILEKLPPASLCSMAGVCNSLRERCVSDFFWEKHMKEKWGRVIGQAAYREWQWHMATKVDLMTSSDESKRRGLMRFLSMAWPFSRTRSKVVINRGEIENPIKQSNITPVDSIMSWFIALETGKFWFPAQVYNRENGHVGFMLSCYDAELSYDQRTDTFKARYPPHGRRPATVESDIPWERLRAAPIDTPPHELHISDCLYDLHPGDHFEIQWRRNKEFPYGWWYGVVGHLDSCDGNELYCRCHSNESVALEFNQYSPGSRWRRMIISRKDHREEGNESDGFYAGIRKLCSESEISTWKRLWPQDVLE